MEAATPTVIMSSAAPPFKQYVQQLLERASQNVNSLTVDLLEGYFREYAWAYFPDKMGMCSEIIESELKEIVDRATEAVMAWQRGQGNPLKAMLKALAELVVRIDIDGKAQEAKYDAERKGRESLRSNSDKRQETKAIGGKRVRHYTNAHTQPLIIKSCSLIISRNSDQGSIFLMHNGHFKALDNMNPSDIKSAFDIRSQNECRNYVEFNLEDSLCTKSPNKHIKLKDQTEIVLGAEVLNLDQRDASWYVYKSGKWEFLLGPYNWGK
jgi:hypothetical protein